MSPAAKVAAQRPARLLTAPAEKSPPQPVDQCGKLTDTQPFYDQVRRFKRHIILIELARYHGHRSNAARALGLRPSKLFRLMRTLNVQDYSRRARR